MSELKTTPLYAWHVAAGAKMASFAGWNMPIQYSGIIDEHLHTRSQTSVFDICHMGQFLIQGQGSAKLLARAVTHNLDTLKLGKCRYGFLLNQQGGVMDDLIIYRLADDEFYLVVNAGCLDSDLAAFQERVKAPGVNVLNLSPGKGKIDVQGPTSLAVMEQLFQTDLKGLGYFSFTHLPFAGKQLMVSRTGYTGELGYELYCERADTLALWEALLKDERVKPAGLGSRDTLRLEAGLPLYGHEMDEQHTPAESGFGAMLTSQAPYLGHDQAGLIREETLIALQLEGKRSARQGDVMLDPATGQAVGNVRSGSFCPSLGYAVATAFVRKEFGEQPQWLIQSGKNQFNAVKTELPFYSKGTARIKLQ